MAQQSKSPKCRKYSTYVTDFPNYLEIPETVKNDRKYQTSYVRIFNDPRVYRRKLNGDVRTSSRFDTDYQIPCPINIVYNEPVLKRKSILLNAENSKENYRNHNYSTSRKSVSFLSTITIIDDSDNQSWTDCSDEFENSNIVQNNKTKKRKLTNEKQMKTNSRPSIKSHTKKVKEKFINKDKKQKSLPKTKELFKFKITKPFRKIVRSKSRKLKNLQRKFGIRIFKSFVRIRRNDIPIEENSLSSDKATNKFIENVTKKLKVVLSTVEFASNDNVAKTNSIKNGESVSTESCIVDTNCITKNSQASDVISSKNCAMSEDNKDNQSIVNNSGVDHVKSNGTVTIEDFNCDLSNKVSQDCHTTFCSKTETINSDESNLFDELKRDTYCNIKEETGVTYGRLLNSDNHMDLMNNLSALKANEFS